MDEGGLDDPTRLVAANQLIEILRECRHRHDELHRHLIGARTRLRDALDDRFTRPPRSVRRCDLAADLLGPYLGRRTRGGATAASRMLAVVGGVATRWLPPLAALVDDLCAPARVPEPGEEYVEPEFAELDLPEWWEPYEDTVASVFDAIDEPIRLSQLLARVGDIAAGVAGAEDAPLDDGLLAAAIVHAAHRAWATRLAGRAAGDPVALAVTTGEWIDTEQVRCADLLLVPAVVMADIEAPPDPVTVELQPNIDLSPDYETNEEQAG